MGQATRSIDEVNYFVLEGDRVTRLDLISRTEFDLFCNWFGKNKFPGALQLFKQTFAQKYCIVPASSPWVPEDAETFDHLQCSSDISELRIHVSRWSGDVMKRPGHKNFNAVSHNCSRPEVLILNLTWRSRGQISSVLLELLLFAFSNRKFGRQGNDLLRFGNGKTTPRTASGCGIRH